jgi:hypothetical protein
MTLNFRIIWTEYRRVTAPLTISPDNHILYTVTNLSAGQTVTIPANLLVLTFYANSL